MDIQRVLERRCQIGKKFRQSAPQGLGNKQCAPDYQNIEKQAQDNVPGSGVLLQYSSPPSIIKSRARWYVTRPAILSMLGVEFLLLSGRSRFVLPI